MLKALAKMISDDLGFSSMDNYNIFEVEFSIKGSENNPHLLTEDGLLFNASGDNILGYDLRCLLYDGVVENKELVVQLLKGR